MAELGTGQQQVKRIFDVIVAALVLVVLSPVIVLAWALAAVTTRRSGIFRQERVGRYGKAFKVMKIRTMRSVGGSTVTASGDDRITPAGAWMRQFKVDELPQLINVLRGEMSLVGPRPDVPGWADALVGADRVVLSVRPGVTSPAAVAYRHEEYLLARAADAEAYNRDVLWPAKVKINREYVEQWTLGSDVRCLADTARTLLAWENHNR